ncbi:MAG: DNA repair protein RadA [Sinobacteraceae bacterium]|nr:DNA repair protein RadA [Nevskiaceae bacterium]MCP5467393.1 DNA repair protein RadA [Nevskiaceae bacterium]MCP5472700.1 DNA repair protein RadA [Nevskiaceae bacterium]
MARSSIVYVCSACGGESAKWQGQCAQCGEWNSLERREAASSRTAAAAGRGSAAGRRTALAAGGAMLALPAEGLPVRFGSGLAELDRVLGGGFVPGSVSLLGGDPGIGKSTLLLQVAASVAQNAPVLYATGEESGAQVGLRARRLGLGATGLQLAPETDLETILAQAGELRAGLLVIDSIQTVQLATLASSAGGVTQLRECAAELVRFAKSTGTAVCIVGHVTREGTIAGPRVLEHLVDTVLYFESDAGSRYRIVRATKNRFGAVNELAFFAMTESGLREVANPSAIFLARPEQVAPGSIVMVAREGGRPLLVEIQGLVDPMRFGNPRRVAQGLDSTRLSMLLAVLHRHGGLSLQDHDVFANVVGGLAVRETGTDLPVLLALASSLRDRALPPTLVAFGEIGLTGEVRPVAYGEERLREAAKQGFRQALVPRDNLPRRPVEGLELRGVARLAEAVEILFER